MHTINKTHGEELHAGRSYRQPLIHHLDLLQWFPFLAQLIRCLVFSKQRSSISKPRIPVVTLNFKSGALGVFEVINAARPFDTEGVGFWILGEGGLVEVGGFAANELKTWNFVDANEADKSVVNDSATNPSDVYGFGHAELYRHFQAALAGKGHSLVTAKEGLDEIILVHAIYESIETGQQVFIDDWKILQTFGHRKAL